MSMSEIHFANWCKNLAKNAKITKRQAKYIHELWKKACDARQLYEIRANNSDTSPILLASAKKNDEETCEHLEQYVKLLGFEVDFGTGIYPILRKGNYDYYYAE